MRVVCLPIHESLILYDKYTDKNVPGTNTSVMGTSD